MLKHITKILALLCLVGLPVYGYCLAWESGADAAFFRTGNLEEVKRAIRRDPEFYKDPQLILEALHTAISSGNVELVKYLTSLGWLEVCRKDKYCYLVHVAAEYGRVGVIRYLISQGFDVHAVTAPTARGEGGKQNALHLAADRGHVGAVKFLCERGVDANVKNESGRTALGEARSAAGTGSLGATPREDARNRANLFRVIEYLESGQCKAAPGDTVDTEDPFDREVGAFRDGDLTAVKGFLARRDTVRDNPRVQVHELYEAAFSGNVELLRYLKGEGWLDRCRKLNYCHPLHVAAESGRLASMEFLIAEGFHIDVSNRIGGTPLQYAALSGHFGATSFLCERGADARKKVYESSLLNALLEPYNDEWCKANVDAERCKFVTGESLTPCVPGLPCDGVPFPPASQKSAQRVHEFNRIYQYLKTGQCKKK